jgi:hypothetical protein
VTRHGALRDEAGDKGAAQARSTSSRSANDSSPNAALPIARGVLRYNA